MYVYIHNYYQIKKQNISSILEGSLVLTFSYYHPNPNND